MYSQTSDHIARRKQFVRFAQSNQQGDEVQDYGAQGIFCPECGAKDYKILETRPSGDSVRRRRQCLECNHRLTTFERPHNSEIDRKLKRLEYLERQLEKIKALAVTAIEVEP